MLKFLASRSRIQNDPSLLGELADQPCHGAGVLGD